MTQPYILTGRSIQEIAATMTTEQLAAGEMAAAPCIFCGTTIEHFNDGGVGWCLGSVVDGKSLSYLYCEQPMCAAVRKYDHLIWRCGCSSDYVEMVGELCTECRRPRCDALPYDWEVDEKELLKLRIDNLRALVLDQVYKLLPERRTQIYGSDPYVSLTGFLSSTGLFEANAELSSCRANAAHVNRMPLETLVELRRILTQHWEQRNVSPPPRIRPEPDASLHRRRAVKSRRR